MAGIEPSPFGSEGYCAYENSRNDLTFTHSFMPMIAKSVTGCKPVSSKTGNSFCWLIKLFVMSITLVTVA